MITTHFYKETMKGDNTPWNFCEVTFPNGEKILFECFPYKHEYLVLGVPVSVHHNYILDLWGVESRKWNTRKRTSWEQYKSREDAFIHAAIKVLAYRIKMKQNNNRHPE